jgi:hypothetical protein
MEIYMENPFAKDQRLEKMANAGANYAIVYPNSPDTLEFIGFKERAKAWHEADDVAGTGLWCYIIDLTYSRFPVIAYLQGFCNQR